MIRVILMDGREQEVEPATLDQLLASGRVRRFLRQSGWVDPRFDSIRRNPLQMYSLPERRAAMRHLLSSGQPLAQNREAGLSGEHVGGPFS